MKQFSVLFFAFVLAFFLAACGGDNNSSGDKSFRTDMPAKSTAPASQAATSSLPVPQQEVFSARLVSEPAAPRLTPTIVSANGWMRVQSAEVPVYMNVDGRAPGAAVIMTVDRVPSDVKTNDEFAAYAQELVKSAFGEAEVSGPNRIIINSMEALEYTAITRPAGNIPFTFKLFYMFIDENAYAVQCSAESSDFDKVKNDFDTMVASYKLQ
ncbi:MAG: hypothetical protein FWF00_00355 [Endomicrobia bacterium]|nr:hypothetical protein [Endomicrobiia bacterium]MCL2506129.1 hypothetical protein [Endomicrobiia bacterium]